jgi:hypothetical protein
LHRNVDPGSSEENATFTLTFFFSVSIFFFGFLPTFVSGGSVSDAVSLSVIVTVAVRGV